MIAKEKIKMSNRNIKKLFLAMLLISCCFKIFGAENNSNLLTEYMQKIKAVLKKNDIVPDDLRPASSEEKKEITNLRYYMNKTYEIRCMNTVQSKKPLSVTDACEKAIASKKPHGILNTMFD
jgi:hypothetical protein